MDREIGSSIYRSFEVLGGICPVTPLYVQVTPEIGSKDNFRVDDTLRTGDLSNPSFRQ